MNKENLIHTESKLQALKEKSRKPKVFGEIETAHPVNLYFRDTFYEAA